MTDTPPPGLREVPRQIESLSLPPAMRLASLRLKTAREVPLTAVRANPTNEPCASRPKTWGELLRRLGGHRQVIERPFRIFIIKQRVEALAQVVGSDVDWDAYGHLGYGCAFDPRTNQVPASAAWAFATCATLVSCSIAADRRSLPPQQNHHGR